MKMKVLRCADFGMDCPAEFRGETVEACLEQAKEHGMNVHGQTRKEVDSEKVMMIAAAKTRDE